jgi:hypothetical protein
MYLVPSRIPNAGRGVVAGTFFMKEDFIEECVTLQVPKPTTYATQLMHYVYGSNHDDYSMVMFGPSSLFNHHANRTVYYTWTDSEVNDASVVILPYANMTGSTFRCSMDIQRGEELLNFYGDDWFQRFDADSSDTTNEIILQQTIADEDLEEFGHCLTNVIVGASQIGGAGRGLFAARDFAAGDIVTVSPVLALDKSIVDASASQCVLINYCLAAPGSELVLFPLNYAAMINHHSEANVEIRWYDWSEAEIALAAKYNAPSAPEEETPPALRLEEKLRMTVRELTQAHFAQLDIAYVATRTISAGEEIFVDYGPRWQAAWESYAEEMAHWEQQEDGGGMELMPSFRHYMEIPADMYADHWYQHESPQQCPA